MVATIALPAALKALVNEVTEKVLSEFYGPEGVPALGTRFETIEETGVQVGDAVARAVIQQAVERQAAEVLAKACSCGTDLEGRDPEPHVLTTRRGDVGWNEPVGYCRRCRRSFFPSEPRTRSAGE